jgi:predicted membrane metal-binding protein
MHFNRLTSYGLIANLIAVPLTGSVVMPMAVAAALAAPFGLSWLALWPMEQALVIILATATEIAAEFSTALLRGLIRDEGIRADSPLGEAHRTGPRKAHV